MNYLDNHCEPGKCCICARECLCLTLDEDQFVLADKDIIEERLTRTHYQSYERALMVKTLNDMEMEEIETKLKEKEDMAVSIKTVDIEKEKEAARDEGYKAGLEEAWEIARKITLYHEDGGYSCDELKDICGDDDPYKAYKNMSIHEVKEKIAAYEAEQAKPKLGDVVTLKCLEFYSDYDTTGIYISESAQYFNLLIKTDAFGADTIRIGKNIVESIEKTGKHFDIQSMLDELKE